MKTPYGVGSELEKCLQAAGFTVRSLELNPSVIYILDPGLRISYCNPAWNTFARQNGGKDLERELVVGKRCLDAVPDALREFYESEFMTAIQTQKPWEHDYECSSPEKYRFFHMRVLPLSSGHLLVENSLFTERPHEAGGISSGVDHSRYIDQNEFITMCANCRRVMAWNSEGKTWDWVPAYLISTPVPLSHGLCPTCLAYYYKVSMISS